MEWIRVKKKLPPCDGNRKFGFVLCYHTTYGIGVGWFWVFDESIKEEIEEEFEDKYLCSCHFIKNKLDGNFLIDDEDDIDIFEHSPHWVNLGTVTHWMPLPQTPEDK